MIRKDAWLKVHGKAKYNDDGYPAACLQARLLTSVFAHAGILSVDVSGAWAVPGVHAVVTGRESAVLTGPILQDMPILAAEKVRYFGEPVAIVVADEEWQAAQAVKSIRVEYQPLPVVNTIEDALASNAPLVHPGLMQYARTVPDVYPEENTNIANRVKIRKGDIAQGWKDSAVVVEAEYRIPQASHAFLETRNARAQILPGGQVVIHTANQAPHALRSMLAKYFSLSENDITVEVPFVGGAYGGKINPHPELLAYIASRAVGGREVRVAYTREESFYTSPCKTGAKVVMKLGADRTGRLQALQAEYYIDCGAYTDTAPVMAKAVAGSCSGAYYIPHIQCDSVCVYTNHVYTTSFRGFGHGVSTFAIERTMDKLADRLGMDPAQLRLLNAAREGDDSPTQVTYTKSNLGDISACIHRMKEIMQWDNGIWTKVSDSVIRAKGMACFTKTSTTPTDASSSAIVTFCSDGTVNLNCSVIECGPGMTSSLPKLLAQRLKISPDKVSVNLTVNTHAHPVHWKTAASMSTYMAGNAVLTAADDAIRQLKANAALALKCSPDDVEIDNGMAYLKENPQKYLELKDIVSGVKDSTGSALGGPVIGCGHFIMKHLSHLDRETGKGQTGPYWTAGAQAVEVEYDLTEYTYRLVRAATVLDAGSVIYPEGAASQVMGAMNMGLSCATREANVYAPGGELKNTSFRTYKVMHFAENPRYTVEFVETPNISGPMGARGLGEHGILGMPAAFANALSRAAGVQLDSLPVTNEALWYSVTQSQQEKSR
ncbi:MAG: xanthine dehydrogenase family protein molybdopterin-binding subunit [Christensenellaceae bacterium]|nr:xanthine dehydrogenase family protein molybdopterin-binding subunit [Christensenellaceae bacterium]